MTFHYIGGTNDGQTVETNAWPEGFHYKQMLTANNRPGNKSGTTIEIETELYEVRHKNGPELHYIKTLKPS